MTSTEEEFPAIVIGAGPAGLATSRELKERGVEHVVLERGDSVGYVWANLYDSLTLHTGKHMSSLPGMRFSRATPLFVPRAQFVKYLNDYAEGFALPVRTGWDVIAVERITSEWRLLVRTAQGDATLRCRDLIVATGIVANPRTPSIPGAAEFEGRLVHSASYRRPDPFYDKKVLIVGVGNSGGEIASELARSGKVTSVTVSVRSGANVVPRQLFGIPIQYLARYMRKLPRKAREVVVRLVGKIVEKRRGPAVLPRPSYGPLDAIPLIGFHLVDAIRDGLVAVRGPIERLTPRGARFADGKQPAEVAFDVIILATGFTAALAPLGQLIRVDAKGFAARKDRIASADHDGLYFVGHNYDTTGGLFNIAHDARLAAVTVAGHQSPITEHSQTA